MRATNDTIVAIATPAGRGAVGIVRIAGADLAPMIAGIIGKSMLPRMATFARFRDAHGDAIDQGLALHFPAPHSFTGDDVLELQGHGGRAVLDLLLARCVELGARLAAPGEFTQRAYLNDKIDLAQAEGVADLIDAASATAARAAARSLTGEFSRAIGDVDAALVELRMFVEATLDFPEEDIDFVRAHDAAARLAAIGVALERLQVRANAGARLRNGISVALVGRPNVGKSSLLNRLSGDDAAIVTPVAGTTRDSIEREIALGGIALTVIDTAGLRDTVDTVERVGIERTWQAITRADVALLVVDARATHHGCTLDAEDAALLARLPASLSKIIVHNKADLAGGGFGVQPRDGVVHVRLSALTGEGIALLERELQQLAGASDASEHGFLARERHLVALRAAAQHVAAATAHLALAAPPLELFAEELRGAHHALSSITGAFTADDLIGVIFARFCIGK
ncbi:MAG: tRNA uridine-5-carboxymethylaminomethyl(34) synthesis GTPase MnmE [Casimicrobiaceae bacterium]